MRSAALLLCLLAAVAHAEAPKPLPTPPAPRPAPSEAALGRMLRLCGDLHAVSPQALARLSAEERRALAAIALDEGRPVYVRARAVAFLGARVDALAEAVWERARRDVHREVRLQAAWAQGLARAREGRGLAFARALLDDPDPRLREVAVHLLFLTAKDEAPEVAEEQLASERDPVVRALLERRLRERAALR